MNTTSSAVELKTKTMKKRILLTILILIFLPTTTLLAERSLDVDYPDIPGGSEAPGTSTSIFQYVKYLFDFSIWILGIIAFGCLVWAGLRYLTSVGSPSAIKDAKDQITAVILGMAILLGSVFILNTINPDLVVLEKQDLEEAEVGPAPSPTAPVSRDPLVRIKDLVQKVRDTIIPNLIEKNEELLELIEECCCCSTFSECDCVGWSCQAIRCYGDPCPNREEIIKKQKEIVLAAAELLYYRNRIDSEREDINSELEHYIYWGRLTESQAENLKKYLEEILAPMEEMANISEEIAELPNECLTAEKCTARCKGICHYDCGNSMPCSPLIPKKGNPCPKSEMEDKIKEVEELQKEINKLCNKIIAILN